MASYLEIYSGVVVPLLKSFRDEISLKYGAIEHENKIDKTVVTELDRSIEKRIREALTDKFPDIGINGEEFGKSGSQDTYWLIDPIDGTENFIRGIAGIGTIIGLVVHDEVVFAALYDPLEDDVYTAGKNEGAYKNGTKMAVSKRQAAGSFMQVTFTTYDVKYLKIMNLLKQRKSTMVRMFGAAQQSWLIASGKIDGFILQGGGGNDWDYAPGRLLMREAGAVIRYFDGKNEIESRFCTILTPTVSQDIEHEIGEILSQK